MWGQCSVSFPNSTASFCVDSDISLSPILNATAIAQSPTFTWSYQNDAASATNPIPGATANSLQLLNAQNAQAGIYTINVDYPANSICSDQFASVTLNLISTPTINAGNNLTICQGQSASLSSSVSGLSAAQLSNVTYNWTSSPGIFNSTSANPTFSGIPVGSTTFNVEASFEQCQFSDAVIVTVNANPSIPTFNLSATGCPQTNIPITGFSTVPGVSYTWNVSGSGGNIAQGSTSSPNAYFNSGGNYTVSVTATQNGCSSSANDAINITSVDVFEPDVQEGINMGYLSSILFDNVPTFRICDGVTTIPISLTNMTGTNNNNTTYTFQWGNGAPVAISGTIDQSAQSGNNLFTISALNAGCTVSQIFNIYIGSNPFVSVGVGSSINLCPGSPVTASINPVPQSGEQNSPGTTYDLYFSNNTNTPFQSYVDLNSVTAANPYLFNTSSCGPAIVNNCFPTQPNVFYAYVVAENACAQSCASSPAITYNSLPVANFIINPNPICVNSNTTITNTGTGGVSVTGNATTGYSCATTYKLKYTISPSSGWTLISGNLGGASGNYVNWTGSETLVMNFSTPGVYTITETIQSNSCGASTIQKTICVIDPPTCSFTATPSTGCSPLTVNTTNNSVAPQCNGTAVPLAYSWVVSTPTNPNFATSTLAQPSFILNNSGTSDLVYTLTLTVTPLDPVTNLPIGNCSSTCSQSVTVYPIPAMTNANSLNLCSGGTMNLDLTSNIPSSYSWSASSNNNVTGVPSGNQTSDPINLTLTNNSLTNQTVTFQVTPTSTSGSCVGSTQTITLTLLPTPVMNSANSITICDNTPVNLSLTASVGSSFSWYATSNANVNGESTTAQTSSTINNTLDNTTNSSSIVSYTVTPTSTAGSCVGNGQTVQVTVNPTPVVTNNSTAAICSGSALNIDLTSNVGASFSWIATNNANVTGESLTAVNSSSINNTLTNNSSSIQNVIYTITPSTSNPTCTGTPFTLTVSVVPAVTVNAISPVTTCNTVPLNIPISANVPSSFSWSTPSNNNVTGESAVAVTSSTINDELTNTSTSQQSLTYTITPTSTTGSCPGNPINVTVNVVPTVSVTSTDTETICSGIPLNINLTSNVASSFSWLAANNPNTTGESTTSTNSALINNIIISNSTSAQNVVYTITPTSTIGNCVGVAQTLTVTVNPAPSMTNVNTVNVCSGSAVSLSLTSNVASTYTWVATNNTQVTGESTVGVTSNTISDILTSSTSAVQNVTYTVTPNSSSGTCSGSTQTVTVSVIPNVTLSNLTTESVCSGTTLNYTFSPNIPATYSWSAADNASITGESTTAQTSSIINNTLVNTTDNTNQNVVYTITPTSVQGSCPGSSITYTVTVIPTPTITNSLSKTICSGEAVNQSLTSSYAGTISWFASNNSSIIGETTVSSIATTIGDVLTNTTNIAQTVTYNISTSTNPGNCSSSVYNLIVTVNPTPAITAGTATICSGQTFTVSPTTSIVPTGTTYSWSAPANTNITSGLAAGTAQSNISGTLVSTASTSTSVTYAVTPTSTQNCTGTNFNVVVTVNPKPNVGNLTAVICSGQAFSVTPDPSIAGNNIPTGTTYTWSAPTGTGFSGGTTQINGQSSIGQVLTNTTADAVTATYTVTPTSSDGCAGLTKCHLLTCAANHLLRGHFQYNHIKFDNDRS
jgi:hypothetical protein